MAAVLGTRFSDALAVVEEHAALSQERQCLADETVEAIAAAGTNRLFLPAALGGLEAHPLEAFRAVAAIAQRDGSAGWCTSIGIGSGIFAGYVGETAARAAFVDPDASNAGVFAPTGTVTIESGDSRRGRVSGRWAFASNCEHSHWIGLGVLVRVGSGDPDPLPRLVFVPRSSVRIDPTWGGGGLLGTGSHHLEVSDLPVDLDLSCRFTDRPWPEGPLWRMPLFTALAPLLVAAPLGIARGAVDRVHLRIVEETTSMRGPLGGDPVGLAALAAGDAALRAATAGVEAAVEQAWAEAVAGRRASRRDQARTMLAVHHAIDVAVDVASLAHRLCGGAAAFDGHPVLVALRDVETARQHALFSHQHRPQLMRIAAGVDEVAPPFVV